MIASRSIRHFVVLTVCAVLTAGALTTAQVVAAPLTAEASAAAATTGPLHTTGTDSLIYDASNRPVRLVGFNWTGTEGGGRSDTQKIADVCGVTWRTPADALSGLTLNYDNFYQVIRGWGYNVIRVPISWNNLEPVAPVWSTNLNRYVHSWNQIYLNDLKSMVTKARAAGVMVILDLHQDFWGPALHNITNWDGSPGYCEGVGMPRWLNPSIDAKAATTQNVDFYNAMNWFYRNLHDPMSTTTRATPWQLFSAVWDQLSYVFSPSSGFADYQAVVGADILNEPYYSYVGGSPPPGQTVLQASGSRLATFYNAIAPAITAHNASWLLFFNDSSGGYNTANPLARETPTMTAKPSVAGHWVYTIHDYNFSYATFSDGVPRHDDFGITLCNAALANANAWGVPLYIGEFTIFTTFGVDARLLTDADMVETKEFLAWAKLNNVSWTFWAYVNPYRPMTVVNYNTNQAIPVVKNALDTGLDIGGVNLPTASFTSSSANLVASFDGSASSDPDGTIASYSWNFGDGTPAGSGMTASHTYATAGTRNVTLTVTDNQGGTNSVTHPVTVTLPAGSPVIVDTFGRTLASGWGSADTGGAWSGTTSSLSVGGGSGLVRIAAPGGAPSVFLPATTTADADLTATMSSDKVGTGNGVYLFAVGRRTATAGDYRLQTRLRADGLVGVSILRTDAAGAQTVIQGEATVPGYSFAAGNKLSVRFQVTGTSPTTLRAKVWPSPATEPTTWLRTGTDTTAGLQVAGSIGFVAFLSGSGTNAPVTTSFDDLNVRPTVAPPPNQNPTASFTSSAVNLAVSFNGSASSDPDGNIVAHSWNFGDGSPAESGATPSHTYAAAGTYQVTLTVTDNQNATASLTKPATVTAGNQSPVAAFTSSTANLSASFNGSTSSDPDGSIAAYSWNFGDGTPAGSGMTPSHTYATAGTRNVTLTVTDNQGGTNSVTHPVTVTAPPGATVIVDTFGRTLASGWGSADTGGTWSGTTASLSVGAGVGVIRVAAPAAAPSVFLTGTTTSDADLTVRMSSDKVGTGNGVYLFTVGRRVTGAGDYRLQTRLRADGLVGASILRTNSAGAQTVIQAEATVPAYTFVAGNKLNVRFQVTGTSPTTLRAKVWPATTTEPATWLRSATDTTAGLQVAGGIGLASYLSGAGTNAPVTTSFDDLYVRRTAP